MADAVIEALIFTCENAWEPSRGDSFMLSACREQTGMVS